VPLSEREQRVFEALEESFYTRDSARSHRVYSKHDARRRLRLSVFALVVGLALLFAFCWTTTVALGVVGFLLMFASLDTIWVETDYLQHARLGGPARLD